MSILFEDAVFHLRTAATSYAFQILGEGHLAHLHWGKRIEHATLKHLLQPAGRAFSPEPAPGLEGFSLDIIPREFPAYGNGDFRAPAVQVQLANGSTITDLRYHSHRVIQGKPALPGLPATYVEDDSEAKTLEIELRDALTGLSAVLSYSVFEELNAITRSVRLQNGGGENLNILRVLSASVDFPDSDYTLLHLSGAWARERHVERARLRPGIQSVESRRGASSHQHNPFFALLAPGADEEHGEVFGFNLVYSGNFLAQVEVDQFSTARAAIGINPFDFSWLLEPGGTFQAPEAVLVFSANGLSGMSRTFHKLYRTRLCRGEWRDKPRPVLINNWEATYFDFDGDKIREIARAGRDLGIELLVLDDRWFGKRDDDRTSLGDWKVHSRKLPEGLDGLGRSIQAMGMEFGLWVEPEMISQDSDLYRAHPNWCLHVPGRPRNRTRHQLVLDFSREDVCDFMIKTLTDILASAPISYVKWDMNRHMTEIGSEGLSATRQRETAHRYILGLYHVMDQLTSAFPRVLFESCSGGGGRFDPGILHYMPQTWTSDNSDAICRLKIQYGTSLVYPVSAMGAHVSAVPNHQVGRVTPLGIRGHVAMSGNFGYEMDLGRLTEGEKRIAREQIETYKEIRSLVQTGDFHRLRSPFEGNETAWIIVNEDQSEAVFFYFRVLSEANILQRRVRLRGLHPKREYTLNGNEGSYLGDVLMNAGLLLPMLSGDFQSLLWRLRGMPPKQG